MNNALIDSRKPALFAAVRRWDLAFGRTHGEVRGAGGVEEDCFTFLPETAF
jgi:hypothetical protein